jgi:hypothetical protein
MDKNPMDTKTQPSDFDSGLTDRRARIALQAALTMLMPLARWLLRNGVHYASFAPALKSVFVEAARRELDAAGAKQTDSAISVLSGVHRRDIRESARAAEHAQQPKTPSVASQAFTRWVTDPAYRGAAGRPAMLLKTGAAPSFDALARQVSSDVHPRTLLAEMQRLGLVLVDDEQVRLCTEAFVPQQGLAENATLLSAHVADHIAAGVHNLGSGEGRFLEQSMYGSGLTAQSIAALGQTARTLWADIFGQIVREATQRFEADRQDPTTPRMRMRFGVYYYAEPEARDSAQAGQEAAAR